MSEARSCPFCGVVPEVIVFKPENEKYTNCYNKECPLYGCDADGVFLFKLEDWNRRYDDEGYLI